MSSRPISLLAFAFTLAAGSAAAQSNASTAVAPQGLPGTSGAVGAATINAGASGASPMNAPTLGSSPGLGPVTAAPLASAPEAALNSPAAIRSPAAANGPAAAPASASPSVGRAPSRAVPSPAVPAASSRRTQASSRAAESAAARDAAAPAPGAGAALNGAARKITEARIEEKAGGGDLSVERALGRTFDAATAAGAATRPGVAGRAQDIRGAIAQKVTIANSASPADAPRLYQDAIRTAKDALPAPTAEGVAKVVRGFASRKADVSLGDLAAAAFQAAAAGSASETGRLLSAFDQWQALLGAPGRPLISNGDALRAGVADLLKSASAGGARSAPHVWFQKQGGSYAAVLPGAAVAAVPALAAAFAIAPSALAPASALGDAYRAFSADPRASNGAGLVFRARRALGASVPAAAASASRFWLRAALETVWRRVVALFRSGPAYRLSQKSGQDSLRRDAASVETARGAAASARRLLSDSRLTVARSAAAFAAAARSAEAYRTLSGEGDAAAAIESLRGAFQSAAAKRGLRPSDAVPPALEALVSGPGGLAQWLARVETEASRAVDARFWRARGAGEFVNLGAPDGPAAAAAAAAKASAGAPVTVVALDDRYWARGRGANGEARLSAELKATASGGAVELSVERGGAALSRRLEDLGLTVFPDGAGLRAVVGPEDFAYGAGDLSLLASRALAAALGRGEPGADAAVLRDLVDDARRDPAAAAGLAALLDGRQAFARAPVIGLVGDYEALAPTAVSVEGKPLLVSALRDPDTGLLAYARARRPDGAPLAAAEIRALLRVK